MDRRDLMIIFLVQMLDLSVGWAAIGKNFDKWWSKKDLAEMKLEALDEIKDLMLIKDDVTGDDFDFFQDCVFRALDELIDS